MKLLHVLLLTASVAIALASIEDFFKKNDSQRGHFEKRNLTRLRGKLNILRERSRRIKPNPADLKNFNELFKSFTHKTRVRTDKDGHSIAEINVMGNMSDFLYQGDVALTDEQADELIETTDDSNETSGNRTRRQAIKIGGVSTKPWASKTFYFSFDSSCSAQCRSVFIKAATIWTSNTCITFVNYDAAPNRVRVFKGNGCYSYIGMIGGVQDLSLGAGCEAVSVAAHEIGHALGFYHQQSRYDRDNFISLNLANADPNFADQYGKETQATNNNYGVTYDYGSIMHYSSGGAKPVMLAKDTKYQDTMGSPIIAFYDFNVMNELYSCMTCGDSITCYNGGYPHPRNCKTCICPSGFGGTTCTGRPTSCGQSIGATTAYQTLRIDIGDGVQTAREDFATCSYHIVAPQGKKVQVRIQSVDYAPYTPGCSFGGVEIVSNEDLRRTGYRVCSNADVGKEFTTTAYFASIVASNRYYKTLMNLQYRYI